MKLRSGHVRIARRLDRYFLAGVVVAGGLGAVVRWYSASRRGLACSPILLLIWGWTRRFLHRDGDSHPTIAATPRPIPRLWWLGTRGLGVGLGEVFLLDAFVPLSREWQRIPHRPTQTWLYFGIAWLVVLVTVVDRIERRFQSEAANDSPLE